MRWGNRVEAVDKDAAHGFSGFTGGTGDLTTILNYSRCLVERGAEWVKYAGERGGVPVGCDI